MRGAGTLKITVRTLTQLAAGSMTVSVVGSTAASNGSGERGTAVAGPVVLSRVPQDLIIGIGDCYTGTGTTDGPLVYYALLGNPGFSLGDVLQEYTLTAGT